MVFPLIGLATALAAEFAPGLVRALAGDVAGDVAASVVGVARNVAGLGPDAGDAELLAAVRGNPELAHKLRLDLAEIELEHERLAQKDRQSARDRDAKIRTAGYRNVRADVMVAGVVLALVFITYQINLHAEIKPGVLAIYNVAVGALLKMLGDAFAFEFGSSRGSKEKDQLRGGR